jgi:hypothetical protein
VIWLGGIVDTVSRVTGNPTITVVEGSTALADSFGAGGDCCRGTIGRSTRQEFKRIPSSTGLVGRLLQTEDSAAEAILALEPVRSRGNLILSHVLL